MLRKAIIACLSIVLTLTLEPAVAGEDLSWPNVPTGSTTGLAIVDSIGFEKNYSHLFSWAGAHEVPCSGVDDTNCLKYAESSMGLIRVLPTCQEKEANNDCVLSLRVSAGGDVRDSQFVRFVDEPGWVANKESGLISGGRSSLWTNPFSQSTDEGFLIRAKGYYHNETGSLKKQNWHISNFSSEVIPYRTVSGPYSAVRKITKSDASSSVGDFSGDWYWQFPPSKCVWVEDGKCGTRMAFGEANRLELKLRLSKSQTGWLSGRLDDPAISLASNGINENVLTVSAKPALVSYVQAFTNNPSPEMLKFAQIYSGGSIVGWRQDLAIPFMTAYRDFLNDTVTKQIPTWSFTNDFGQPTNPCLVSSTKLVGLVTTNATSYQSGAPNFTGGSLIYSVGSLHYAPDGLSLIHI
jgi:hypothetical protein